MARITAAIVKNKSRNKYMFMDTYLSDLLFTAASRSPYLGMFGIFAASVLIWLLFAWYVVAFVFHKKGWVREFLAFSLGMVAIYMFNFAMIYWWFRIRPFVAENYTPLINVYAQTKSFPSDHTAIAFFLAFLLGAHKRSWAPIAYVLAGLVGIGRVLVGVHYPIDIFAGALVGLAFGWLTVEVEKLICPTAFASQPQLVMTGELVEEPKKVVKSKVRRAKKS